MEACEQHFKDEATPREEPPFPCVRDPNTIEFLRRHGRVFFITRGPHWCGKSDLVSKLHDLYPDSVSYWADKIFSAPVAPVRTASTVAKSHDLCKENVSRAESVHHSVRSLRTLRLR
ncbi:hypothetical protein HPB48_008265 [Haemaphysalis longicornis]|uniref:Uncharacterized protein n=1 Tax=Haemaphysalis longicornis TaxID=44386 RepID=A0A9J6GSA8_HAELO|nr:hypothetical protein HPB48_008265 [Haemaphysalis longicornis]